MWTEEEEKRWSELTEKREENKADVGKQHTIEMLQKMIDLLKDGNDLPAEIEVEYIRGHELFASMCPGPVIGKKITLIYRGL